ncbi:MAG: hypothetical protein V7637_4366 [Mycobacteriales bacterium]|jgi:hypothetical protein
MSRPHDVVGPARVGPAGDGPHRRTPNCRRGRRGPPTELAQVVV